MALEGTDARLRFAIACKRLIQFKYTGALRVAEPHDYGLYKGSLRLLVYQLSNSGKSGAEIRGWRLLELEKLSECVVLEATFSGSRGHAHQNHYSWDVVYARVA